MKKLAERHDRMQWIASSRQKYQYERNERDSLNLLDNS